MIAHRCSMSVSVIWVCCGLALILLWSGQKIVFGAGADKPVNQSSAVSESDPKQRRISVYLGDAQEIVKRPLSGKELKKLTDQFFQAANILTDAWGIANNASSRQELNRALPKCQQALKVFRSIGSEGMQGLALSDMGNVYAELGDYQKALEHYAEAVVLHRKNGNTWDEGWTWTKMGEGYTHLGQHEKAMEAYAKALEIHRQTGYLMGEAVDLLGTGVVRSILGQHEKALDYYEKALTINRKAGYMEGERQSLEMMGQAYGKLGQDAKAKEYLGKAREIKRALEEGQKTGAPRDSSGSR